MIRKRKQRGELIVRILSGLFKPRKEGQIGCADASSLSICSRREMFTVNRRTTDLIDKASTASSAFFRYPANSSNAMKYHTSRLHDIVYQKHSHLKLAVIVNWVIINN